MILHQTFTVLAWAIGLGLTVLIRRRLGAVLQTPSLLTRPWWGACALLGGAGGAVLFGSLNLWLAGLDGGGRSVLGGLAGAIAGVELYKRITGLQGSTGVGVVAPLCAGIAVGRIGCLLGGLEDFTYGLPTGAGWGWDFGDGIPRHPVQLYESLCMGSFLLWFLPRVLRGEPLVLRHGFSLFIACYAAQRFVWEFLKPYPVVLGPLNLFHLLCLGLLGYAAAMVRLRERT